MIEEWKDIKGYEGLYQVSNLGRVKSLKRETHMIDGRVRTENEKILKPIKDKHGYYKVTLYNKNKTKQIKIHTLVISEFISERPENRVINHIDEDKSNNRLTNLEYITQKDNINHGSGNERRRINQPHSVRLKAIKDNMVIEFNSITDCAIELRLSTGHISECLRGKRKTHGGWKFERI